MFRNFLFGLRLGADQASMEHAPLPVRRAMVIFLRAAKA